MLVNYFAIHLIYFPFHSFHHGLLIGLRKKSCWLFQILHNSVDSMENSKKFHLKRFSNRPGCFPRPLKTLQTLPQVHGLPAR